MQPKTIHFIFDFRIISGGFLGVDIFFVISGYLISSLLFKEYLNDNKINFLNFYIRRIRRLLPLLFGKTERPKGPSKKLVALPA